MMGVGGRSKGMVTTVTTEGPYLESQAQDKDSYLG